MPNAGPKRTRTQREADLAETARLDRMGLTQRQIAQRIGVSCVQICFDLRKLRKRYVAAANVHAGERIGELLACYRDVRREAWQAWERKSDPRYLQVLLDTYAAERRLLGLDQLSPADFLTAANVVTLMNTVMAAVGMRVQDPETVQRIKEDVLRLLPATVQAEADGLNSRPHTLGTSASPTPDARLDATDATAANDTEPQPMPTLNGLHYAEFFEEI
jgi:hypothetical protein